MSKALDSGGLGYLLGKFKTWATGLFATKDAVGAFEAPYTEVEWVESNGKQYVYLDWKPPIATWGFEADFIIRNTFNTTQAAWNASTNVNGAGFLFGTRNASGVNDAEYGAYGTTGLLRIGSSSNVLSSGSMLTDRTSRQTIKLIGTTLTNADGTTKAVTRVSETANKPYANMAVFAYHDGLRRSGSGNLLYPSTSRIYSLKFYESTTLAVSLVGAVRNSDGITGLYDKVSGHFYPAPGMTHGDTVGELGSPRTIALEVSNTIVEAYANNLTDRRMWRVTLPTLDKLEDGQKIAITPLYSVVKSYQTTELAGWDDTGENTYVYMKLTLADGSITDWIPCYYMGASRLTTHYGAGVPMLFTYRENMFAGATDTASGSSIMRAFFADANYDTNTYPVYLQHQNNILAKAAITAESVIVGDSSGYQRVASGVTFDISYPIVWCTAAVAAGSSNYANMFLCNYDKNIATGAKAGYTSAANKVQYLVVTISGKTATIDSTIVTDTLPTSDDGKVYIVLGKLGNQSTGANYFLFYPNHPMFWYKNGAMRPYGTYGHAVNSDVPANAVFTDTTALGSMTGTLAISQGGTGKTTAAEAWTALGGGAIGKKASLAASDIPAHAASATTYGAGDGSNYGHVKLSDATNSTSAASAGIAATPKAVKTAYDLASTANTTANGALSVAQGALVFDTVYTIYEDNGETYASFVAFVYQGGVDVTNQFDDSAFTWYLRLGTSLDNDLIYLGDGPAMDDIPLATVSVGYGGSVICYFDDGRSA